MLTAAAVLIVLMVAAAVVVIAGIHAWTGSASAHIILRAADHKASSSVVIHVIYYRLTEKLSILWAHVDLHTPALEDHVILLLIAQGKAIVRSGSIYCRQEHSDHLPFHQAALYNICRRISYLDHEKHSRNISPQNSYLKILLQDTIQENDGKHWNETAKPRLTLFDIIALCGG